MPRGHGPGETAPQNPSFLLGSSTGYNPPPVHQRNPSRSGIGQDRLKQPPDCPPPGCISQVLGPKVPDSIPQATEPGNGRGKGTCSRCLPEGREQPPVGRSHRLQAGFGTRENPIGGRCNLLAHWRAFGPSPTVRERPLVARQRTRS
jgi:hypothetical protein